MHEFDNLKLQLEQQEWPNLYFFKFIIPTDSEKIALITQLFDNESEVTIHPSGKGNYTSISAKIIMMDVDSIIQIYEQASKIEGIISL